MKTVFLDIDGTLMQYPVGIPKSAVNAIQQARNNGHLVCICTGRPRPDVDEMILSIGFDALICSCGCYVEVNQKMLHTSLMPLSLLKRLAGILEQSRIGFNLEGVERSYLDQRAWRIFQDMFTLEQHCNSELARNYMASIHMLPYSRMKEEDWHQIVKVSVFANDRNAFSFLLPLLDDSFTFTAHPLGASTIINGEISLSHVTKATGIDHVLTYYDRRLHDTIAIGDSMNDAPMIRHCQIGICMGNGCDELKCLSDDQCPSVEEDGIFHAFKKYKLI